MKLLDLNKKIFLFLFLSFYSSTVLSENSVNLWKKENLDRKNNPNKIEKSIQTKIETNIDINTKAPEKFKVSSDSLALKIDPIYGIYDPSENNLTLEMWLHSEGTRVKDTIDRINKIKLSSFSEELFVNTLFTISSLPSQNMTEKEFVNYKIDKNMFTCVLFSKMQIVTGF